MSRAKERLRSVKETKDSVTLLPCFYFVEVNVRPSVCLRVSVCLGGDGLWWTDGSRRHDVLAAAGRLRGLWGLTLQGVLGGEPF